MLRAHGDVSKRLKDKAPFLAAHHCIAHHLALACGQSADEISYLKQFKESTVSFLQQFCCPYNRFCAIQEVLDDPQLKVM